MFYVNGKNVYKTKVLDNIGDNSEWNDLGFKSIVSEKIL